MSYIKILISATILMLTIRTLVDCNCSILNIEHGGPSKTTTSEGTDVTIMCQPGYTLDGQESGITCTNSVWVAVSGAAARRRKRSPSAIPICRKICGNPNIMNGEIGNASTAFRNKSVSVICNQGFVVDGQPDTIMCEASGSWSPSPLPSCQKLCGQPNIMNGSIGNASIVHTNESVVVICNEEFSLDGQSDLIMCQSDGVWSLLPNCSLIPAAIQTTTPTEDLTTVDTSNTTTQPLASNTTELSNFTTSNFTNATTQPDIDPWTIIFTTTIVTSKPTPPTTTRKTTTKSTTKTTKSTTKTTKSSLPSSTLKRNTGQAGAPTTTGPINSCNTIRPTGIAMAILILYPVLISVLRLQ